MTLAVNLPGNSTSDITSLSLVGALTVGDSDGTGWLMGWEAASMELPRRSYLAGSMRSPNLDSIIVMCTDATTTHNFQACNRSKCFGKYDSTFRDLQLVNAQVAIHRGEGVHGTITLSETAMSLYGFDGELDMLNISVPLGASASGHFTAGWGPRVPTLHGDDRWAYKAFTPPPLPLSLLLALPLPC